VATRSGRGVICVIQKVHSVSKSQRRSNDPKSNNDKVFISPLALIQPSVDFNTGAKNSANHLLSNNKPLLPRFVPVVIF
jgi:hypothetical protein